MAAGENWSLQEVSATVQDYMSMLQFELAGQPYNKTVHRRTLVQQLQGRSDSAVELKHQNISAVLRDLGCFWIPGYKPRSNYQNILADQVESWLRVHPELDRYALAAAEAPAVTPDHFDFSGFEVDQPLMRSRSESGVQEYRADFGATTIGRTRDYAACEARNRSLGLAGEELVVEFERYRLAQFGLANLAAKVEHVSKTQGDGLGFDILSFDQRGTERFIEVKTTAFARETPFFASSGEVRFAERNETQFALCRVFEFKKGPKCYTLHGPIQKHCALDPVSYRCSFG